jgi:hypothetical protein
MIQVEGKGEMGIRKVEDEKTNKWINPESTSIGSGGT